MNKEPPIQYNSYLQRHFDQYQERVSRICSELQQSFLNKKQLLQDIN